MFTMFLEPEMEMVVEIEGKALRNLPKLMIKPGRSQSKTPKSKEVAHES